MAGKLGAIFSLGKLQCSPYVLIMPVSHPPAHQYPGKCRTLRDAAVDGQVITLRCNVCRRKAHFLASDLLDIVGPDWPMHEPVLPCHKHGREYVDMRARLPRQQDLGKLPVRRPAKLIQTWKTVMLGDG
ncbi:MAG: hypothetical protein AB3N15_10505 [Paracoccaceae bacterium]